MGDKLAALRKRIDEVGTTLHMHTQTRTRWSTHPLPPTELGEAARRLTRAVTAVTAATALPTHTQDSKLKAIQSCGLEIVALRRQIKV